MYMYALYINFTQHLIPKPGTKSVQMVRQSTFSKSNHFSNTYFLSSIIGAYVFLILITYILFVAMLFHKKGRDKWNEKKGWSECALLNLILIVVDLLFSATEDDVNRYTKKYKFKQYRLPRVRNSCLYSFEL